MKFINTGILLMLLVAFYQSLLSFIVKAMSGDITTGIEVLAYYFIPLCFLIPLVFKRGFNAFKTDQILFLFTRGGFSVAAVFCFFYASEHINLGVAAVLFNTVPIFIPLLASIFLKEKTHPILYVPILISLIGVILVIHPGFGNFISIDSLIGIASGILMAFSQIMLRHLARIKTSIDKIVFYQYLTSSIITLGVIAFEVFSMHGTTILKTLEPKTLPFVIAMLLLLGIISLIAQRVLTKAFHYLPASILAPFLYVSVPISSIVGWVVWGQKLTLTMVTGCLLVILGACIITYISMLTNKISTLTGVKI